MDAMYLNRLQLNNFRNYTSFDLSLKKGPVILIGDNGAGKTNLLEAVSLLGPGNGLRGSPYGEMLNIRHGESWSISSKLNGLLGEVSLGTGMDRPKKDERATRLFRVDGETAKSSRSFSDHVRIVSLTPAQDGVFTGSPSSRRKFIDRLITALRPDFRTLLGQYERALRQRNKLFEQHSRDPGHFVGLEKQLAETGTAISAIRLEVTALLSKRSMAMWGQKQNEFPVVSLGMLGEIEQDLMDKSALEAEERHVMRLSANRLAEATAGRTKSGPHRSDLVVHFGTDKIPASLCSSGEQKALLVGTLLAHGELVREEVGGVSPLYLLDEICAHLDAKRLGFLFDYMAETGAQFWLSGQAADQFSHLAHKAQFVQLKNGEIYY